MSEKLEHYYASTITEDVKDWCDLRLRGFHFAARAYAKLITRKLDRREAVIAKTLGGLS